ncbi:MAG: response regulator [Nitrospiria bacterium]
MKNPEPLIILLVEDSLHDIEIARRAFSKALVKTNLMVARDGHEALDYLKHRGKFQIPESSPRPSLILLDLNLPKINGLAVLKKIKGDKDLKSIPVIILTVSQREEDISPSYDFGANTYIQKPVEFKDFMRVVKGIHEYWADIASLPA